MRAGKPVGKAVLTAAVLAVLTLSLGGTSASKGVDRTRHLRAAQALHRRAGDHPEPVRRRDRAARGHLRRRPRDAARPRPALLVHGPGELPRDAGRDVGELRRPRHRDHGPRRPADRRGAHRGHAGLAGRGPAGRPHREDRGARHQGHEPARRGQADARAQGHQGHDHGRARGHARSRSTSRSCARSSRSRASRPRSSSRGSATSASGSSRSGRRRTWSRPSRSSTRAGKLAGLIVDVRNNPGGLLSAAVEVSEEFLGDGKLIVYTEGRVRNQNMRFTAHAKRAITEVPLVVLVNQGSASASEIVAGAIQDHGRGVVIGQQTFGKGSVQTIIPLADGSGLRLTTARYFTPKGRSIHGKGITPDIVIDPPKDEVTAVEAGHAAPVRGGADEAGRPAPARDRDPEGVPDPRQDQADREGRLERRAPAGPAGRDSRPGPPGGPRPRACSFSASRPPVTRPRRPSWPTGRCGRTSSSPRTRSTRATAASCPSWPRAGTSRSCCPSSPARSTTRACGSATSTASR